MQLIFSKPQSAPHRTTPLGKFRPPPIRHQPQPFRPTLLWVNGSDLKSSNCRLSTTAYPRLRTSLNAQPLSRRPITQGPKSPLKTPLTHAQSAAPRSPGKRRLQLAAHCVIRHSLRATHRQLLTSCRPCRPLGQHQQQRQHRQALACRQPRPRWSGTALQWKQRSAEQSG